MILNIKIDYKIKNKDERSIINKIKNYHNI